jgi:four helix bundle protein
METQSRRETQAAALEERLVKLAADISPVANRLSDSFAGRHIAGQMIRSGTSPAPNYAEARSAESRADFIHKLRIAVKELNETAIWLRIVDKARLLDGVSLSALMQECDEVRRIIGASLRTARLRGAAAHELMTNNQ